ncbi:GlxA family transcriptional regulator [Rhizosphaericola mali]|uniref:GlxA family transcriptional regulator n=1 Tax=Rhizosphaericola mali TaxID=2545455 RepID=A0A5P2G800_9BACT|nr:GlxA family transcriptional regulator [Rhizosphaericola mali]QES87651.1 GlxA family transcriptional regulator [Rhizosphaericola mali]
MKHIVILVPTQTSILDVTGPLEVLTKSNEYFSKLNNDNKQYYKCHLISMDEQTIVSTTSGMPIITEGGISSIYYPIDTIIVAGRGKYIQNAPEEIIIWLKKISKKNAVKRITSVCAGAFILAEAGLLDKRRATTHWLLCDELAKRYPSILVEKEPIYIKDGNVYTSAGISTGIDLTLALVEEDLSRIIAMNVAKLLVLYIKRPGNQSQFSPVLMAQTTEYGPIAKVMEWVQQNLQSDLSVENLAEIAHMSNRNFSRIFSKEIGVSPAKFVEKTRVEAARRLMEESDFNLEQISSICGLSNANGLRRLFHRHLATTPGLYLKNFG